MIIFIIINIIILIMNNNLNNNSLDKIYQKVNKNRNDLIKKNPLKKSNIIDLEENQLNKFLEKKKNNNNYLKEREKKNIWNQKMI